MEWLTLEQAKIICQWFQQQRMTRIKENLRDNTIDDSLRFKDDFILEPTTHATDDTNSIETI